MLLIITSLINRQRVKAVFNADLERIHAGLEVKQMNEYATRNEVYYIFFVTRI